MRAAGSAQPVLIEPRGFQLAATLESARSVLTRPDDYALPFDARRRAVSGDRPSSMPVLSPAAVGVGREVFARSLTEALDAARDRPGVVDALDLVRDPVAWSTTTALLPDLDLAARDRVAERVVGWVDSLGPVISAHRPPRPWSRVRRAEQRAWRELLEALRDTGCEDPPLMATALAAGVQVPMAAGAGCLAVLAADPALQRLVRDDETLALPLVWEVLRLFPPTWLLPRITTREVVLAGTPLPAYTPVVVSPVALGRIPDLVPGGRLDHLDPTRWTTGQVRPGAWLPFGAGPHACPGRNLGLAQLTELARQLRDFELEALGPVQVNADRGLSLSTSGIRLRRTVRDA